MHWRALPFGAGLLILVALTGCGGANGPRHTPDTGSDASEDGIPVEYVSDADVEADASTEAPQHDFDAGDGDGDGAASEAGAARPDAQAEVTVHLDSGESGVAVDAAIDAAGLQDAALPDRIVLASGQHGPTGIAVNDSFVYFANRDDGTIVRCAHASCGAGPEVVVSSADHPIAVALDATHLYWVTGYRTGETGAPPSRPVFRCPLADCSVPNRVQIEQSTLQPYALAVTDDMLYFASWPHLGRCPKAGCSGGYTAIGAGPFVSVAFDGTSIYGAKYGQRGVVRCPASGCSTELPFVSDVYPIGIAVDTDSLYIADYEALVFGPPTDGGIPGARVLRCAKPECAGGAKVVDDGDISPYALATFGDRLFFTNVAHGTVVSLRK